MTVLPNDVRRLTSRVTNDIHSKQTFVNFFDEASFLVQSGGVGILVDSFDHAFLIRISEILECSILALLSLKSNESSDWSDHLVSFLFGDLFNLFIKWWHLLKLALGNKRSTLFQDCKEFLVGKAKGNVGDSDVDILNDLGDSVELTSEVVLQESFACDNGETFVLVVGSGATLGKSVVGGQLDLEQIPHLFGDLVLNGEV